MNWRRALLIFVLLMPGLGVILLMIGSVFYVAVMQSLPLGFGIFALIKLEISPARLTFRLPAFTDFSILFLHPRPV